MQNEGWWWLHGACDGPGTPTNLRAPAHSLLTPQGAQPPNYRWRSWGGATCPVTEDKAKIQAWGLWQLHLFHWPPHRTWWACLQGFFCRQIRWSTWYLPRGYTNASWHLHLSGEPRVKQTILGYYRWRIIPRPSLKMHPIEMSNKWEGKKRKTLHVS